MSAPSTTTRRRLLKLIAVGTGGLMAACTFEGRPSPSTGVTATSSTAAKSTGPLTVAVPPPITELGLPQFGTGTNKLHWDLFYDYLLRTDDKTGQLAPGLATSWKVTPDAKTWTFTLRPNVAFHGDYGTLSSADVAFGVMQIAKTPTHNKASTWNRYLARIDTPDPMTVVFQLKEPWPFLGFELANRGGPASPIICKQYVEKVGVDAAALAPIGTGPFEYVSRVTGSSITGKPNVRYWGEVPGLTQVTLRWVPDTAARLAMVRSGEADIVSLPNSFVASLVTPTSGYRKIASPNGLTDVSVQLGGLYLPTRDGFDPNSPLLKRAVRQALNLAVNRDEINKKIFSGLGTLSGVNVYAPSLAQFDPKWAPYPYDPSKAKALLTEAGYPNGFDIKMKSFVMSGVPELPDVAAAVANYWQAIGVRVSTEAVDFTKWLSDLEKYKAAGAAYPFRSSTAGLYDVFARLGIYWGLTGGQVHLYEDQGLQEITDKVNAELDLNKQLALVRQFFQKIYDEYTAVPILWVPSFYVYGSRITSWDLQDTYGLDLNSVVLK